MHEPGDRLPPSLLALSLWPQLPTGCGLWKPTSVSRAQTQCQPCGPDLSAHTSASLSAPRATLSLASCAPPGRLQFRLLFAGWNLYKWFIVPGGALNSPKVGPPEFSSSFMPSWASGKQRGLREALGVGWQGDCGFLSRCTGSQVGAREQVQARCLF